MAIANELTINTSASAMDMANAIFGDGVEVLSASYQGDTVQSGIYSGATTTIAGISPTDSGVILSTGNVGSFTNSSGSTNTNTVSNATTNTAGGINGDSQLNALAGSSTYDGAILSATFVPDGDYLTMQFVFSSEEYPEYVSKGFNDVFGVWVNGTLVPVSITAAGAVSIDTVNATANQNFYHDNTTDQYNTEMDAFTYVLSLKAPVLVGQANSIKIAIADGGDASYDSNLLIAADSLQTVTLAMDDDVNVVRGGSHTFDVLANDVDNLNSGLTITQINGVDVVPGQTVTLPTGERVRLNADGTLTIFATTGLGADNFSYTVMNGDGVTDVGYITINTVAAPTRDGIVSGTSGADVIGPGYTGDPDGDLVDSNDATGVQGTTGDGDVIYAGAGNDTVSAGQGNDIVHGGDGDDQIAGGSGNDVLHGGDGADVLSGGDGADTLRGGAGNDTLQGGAGTDLMLGGDDADSFVVGAGTEAFGDVINGGAGGNDSDTLDLSAWGWERTNIIYGGGDNQSGTVEFLDSNGNVIGTMAFSEIETVIPCFTPGCLIVTDQGEVPVEDLVPGDRILTRDHGFQPLRWTGRRDLSPRDLLRQPRLAPIRISRGALGDNTPERALTVSPQHRLLLGGARAEMFFGEAEVLVAATHLAGHDGIARLTPREGISYIHLLFDRHEIIRSDGAWSESFQPGNRTLNGMDAEQRHEVLELFPELAREGVAYPAARITLKYHEARVLLGA